MKLHIAIFVLFLLCFANVKAQQQLANKPNKFKQIQLKVLAETETPEGIIGERKVTAKFFVKWIKPKVDLTPQIQEVHFYYSTDSTLLTSHQDIISNKGVIKSMFTNNSYSVIIPHEGNPQPDGIIQQFRTQNETILTNFETGVRLFYKWYVKLANYGWHSTEIQSFKVPRPLNIVIVGDSFASGEGSPDLTGSSPWLNKNDHRSRLSGEFLAVENFKNQHRDIAVQFSPLFVACSGAKIQHVIDTSFGPQFCDGDNITNQPQLIQINNLLKNGKIGGKIDALVISIGGNNVGFEPVVKMAFGGVLSENISPLTRNITRLDSVYKAMANVIDGMCVPHVFAMEYPDPTHKAGLPPDLSSDDLRRIETFGGLPENIGSFLLSAIGESALANVQNAALDGCNLVSEFSNLFGGPNINCNDITVFRHENYDFVKNYLCCQCTNLDNYAAILPVLDGISGNPIKRIELLAQTIKQYLECMVNTGNNNFDSNMFCLAECLNAQANHTTSNAALSSTFLATQSDLQAAHNQILEPMNLVIRNIASARPNWHYVGGTVDISRGHGLWSCIDNSCTESERYFNSVLASYQQQGSYNGTAHMNATGQSRVYVPTLLASLDQHLSARSNRMEQPSSSQCKLTRLPDSVHNTINDMKNEAGNFIDNFGSEFIRTHIPIIRIIIDKLDPKLFASQFMNESFTNMRNRRLNLKK